MTLHLLNILSTVWETDSILKLPQHLRHLITYRKTLEEKNFYLSREGNTDFLSFHSFFCCCWRGNRCKTILIKCMLDIYIPVMGNLEPGEFLKDIKILC